MSVTRTTDIRYTKVVDHETSQTYFTQDNPTYFSGGAYERYNSIKDADKYTPDRIAEDVKKRIEAVMADPGVRLEVVLMIDESFE